MPIVSVTRFRARARRFLPLFMFHAQRSLVQVRRADGYLAGAVRCDRDRAYWTLTVWRDARAMLGYVGSGAHRNAMPRLLDWGEEASTVHWEQDGPDLPDWQQAVSRMRREGRALPLRHPGPDHADLGFADAEATFASRV